MTGRVGFRGATGATGATGPIGVTGSTGVTFSGPPSHELSIVRYGTVGLYDITPDTTFTWSINAYGQSIVSLPVTRTSFVLENFVGTAPTSSIFTDIFGNRYQVYVFTADASFTMTNTAGGSGGYVNMCLIGGGGGGGGASTALANSTCGGAGAGQLMFVDNYLMSNGTYHIKIGEGDPGGSTGVGAGLTSGQDGSGTILRNSTSTQLFLAAGGAGGVKGSNAIASNGLDGSYNIFPKPTNLRLGTSSASGGNASDISGGIAVKVEYDDVIVPDINLPAQVWSYGNDGGNGYNSGGNRSGGGGGGAGGHGRDGSSNAVGGYGGKGMFIYFDSSYGRAVCGGGEGGGFPVNDYSIYPYDAAKYWYTPGSGYPEPYSYGAGTHNPLHRNAYANTGSGGSSGTLVLDGGRGGSGLFMIRYKLYS
jgi:hypothetical protein